MTLWLRHFLSVAALGLLSAKLLAQGAPTPTLAVPTIREPHHTVKLENRFVRVLDVTVPVFDGTLFHIHPDPYVWVSIGAATLKGQILGAANFTDIVTKDGEVRFSDPVTHRVGNIGTTPFRNITMEILNRDVSSPTPSDVPTTTPSLATTLDNALVHVDRLTLAPGQSSGRHRHAKSSLIVAVHGGTLRVEADGRAVEEVEMQPGDFEWHTGSLAHTLANAGAAAFEAIEVTWK